MIVGDWGLMVLKGAVVIVRVNGTEGSSYDSGG